MSFFGGPQQAQLMAQFFQNQNGGMGPVMPGQGGVSNGGANIGPSFAGPDGAPGVQTLPGSGPMPDFTMAPYDPRNPVPGTELRELGPTQGMPAPPVDFEQQPGQNVPGNGGFIEGFNQGFNPNRPPNGPSMRPPYGFRQMPGQNPDQQRQDPGFNPVNPDEEQRRKVLIEAIMRKAFGGPIMNQY